MLNVQSTLDWTIADSIDHSRFIQTLYMFGPLFGVKTVITVTVCTGWSHWESRSLTWSAGFFEFLVRFLSATKEVLQNGPSMVGDRSLITDHQSRKANEANAKQMLSIPKLLLVKIHMLDGQPTAEIGNCKEINCRTVPKKIKLHWCNEVFSIWRSVCHRSDYGISTPKASTVMIELLCSHWKKPLSTKWH